MALNIIKADSAEEAGKVYEQQGAVEMSDTEGLDSIEVVPQQQAPTQTTVCDHFLVWESHDIAVCNKGCGHGCSVNPDFFEIVDGKIVPKKGTE